MVYSKDGLKYGKIDRVITSQKQLRVQWNNGIKEIVDEDYITYDETVYIERPKIETIDIDRYKEIINISEDGNYNIPTKVVKQLVDNNEYNRSISIEFLKYLALHEDIRYTLAIYLWSTNWYQQCNAKIRSSLIYEDGDIKQIPSLTRGEIVQTLKAIESPNMNVDLGDFKKWNHQVDVIKPSLDTLLINSFFSDREQRIVSNKIGTVVSTTCSNIILINKLLNVFHIYQKWMDKNNYSFKDCFLMRRSLTDINSYSGPSKPWLNFSAFTYGTKPIPGERHSLLILYINKPIRDVIFIDSLSTQPREQEALMAPVLFLMKSITIDEKQINKFDIDKSSILQSSLKGSIILNVEYKQEPMQLTIEGGGKPGSDSILLCSNEIAMDIDLYNKYIPESTIDTSSFIQRKLHILRMLYNKPFMKDIVKKEIIHTLYDSIRF